MGRVETRRGNEREGEQNGKSGREGCMRETRKEKRGMRGANDVIAFWKRKK